MNKNIVNFCNNFNPRIDSGLIIIADISGFTDYINETDIEHSQKNIAKLLEVIKDTNELELSVSEIEVDTVFFFKFEDASSFIDIINQIKKVSHKFYDVLEELVSNKDCKCGACSVLANLNLKFIVHTGKIGTIMIKDYCKLYGFDIIIAHRLLKNSLSINEYALFTNKIIQKYSKEVKVIFPKDSTLLQEEFYYDTIGKI